MTIPRLHVVTDDEVLGRPDFPEMAAAVVDAGGEEVALHVRGPHTAGRTVYTMVTALREAASAAGALLVVNDRIDVALATGLGAVHLGARSLAPAEARRLLGDDVLIGRSIHDEEAAVAARADWLFFGHVFATPSHPGTPGRGPEALARAVGAAAGVPVVAIGGVDPSRVSEVTAKGAYGVAALRGVWDASDPAGAVRDYISALGG
ncbi:MAG: thiamine phosphate synthase [Longimicrobiales bacterium]|nr:thiamine phosphate synthase [Longimicrobiales bacterium]